MTWLLVLIVIDGAGRKSMSEATPLDWWRCRRIEMRIAASYRDTYAGLPIIGAACLRRRHEASAHCPAGRACKA